MSRSKFLLVCIRDGSARSLLEIIRKTRRGHVRRRRGQKRGMREKVRRRILGGEKRVERKAGSRPM
jgi:hypothetical protein